MIELDLHTTPKGVSDNYIKSQIFEFISILKEKKKKNAKIITGKGKNSRFGPVIKPIVEYFLMDCVKDKLIKRFEYEKLSNGSINDGAIIIYFW